MKALKYIALFGLLSTLSSCALVDLGLAYLGYSIVVIVVLGVVMFLFTILHGITNSQGWSIFLTLIITLFLMAIIFRW